MSTFKTTLKILLTHRLVMVIYVVWLCMMMFGLSWSLIQDLASSDNSTTFDTARAEVAIVNHDSADSDAFIQSMREFLAHDCDLVDIGTTSEDLQTAVASNYTDLIVIVPEHYTHDFAQALTDGNSLPQLDIVVSYTGSYGSLAKLQVDNFLNLTRTEALAQQDSQKTGITAAALNTAAHTVIATADASHNAFPTINVVSDPHAASDKQEAARTSFVNTVKMGVYPLVTAMLVCTALAMNAFAEANVRRRLYATAQHTGSLMLQQFAGCAVFSLCISILYWAGSFALVAMGGLPLSGISLSTALLSCISLIVYGLISVAAGFMLSMISMNSVAINAIANVYGLFIMFTSGMAFPIDMMPKAMIMIGKLMPGWWFCQSIEAVSGVDNAIDTSSWLADNALMAVFGVTFICLGVAFSHLRRLHPHIQSSASTQLAEI